MEKITDKKTTIMILSNSAYRFNFIKMKNKIKNQDIFLNILLDLYEKEKRKKKKRVIKKK